MKNLIESLVKGVGWGLGFSIAFLGTIWVFDNLVEIKPRKVEHVWPDDEYNNTEKLSPDELAELEVLIDDIYMIEGSIIITGKIVNRLERDAFWIEAETKVALEGKIIEICAPKDEPRINVGEEAEFVTFCRAKWNEVALESLEIETRVKDASAYKDS